MTEVVLKFLYIISIMFFLSGSIISLGSSLYKNQRIACSISNLAAIFGASTGVMFSLSKLLFFNKGSIKFSTPGSLELIDFTFSLDNLSAFFFFVICLLALIVSIFSFGYLKSYFKKYNLGYFGFLYNLFIASMLLVVSSSNIFLFLVLWEIMSLVSYFLVVYENDRDEVHKAGIMYIIMTHIGTAFIIASFVLIYYYTGSMTFEAVDVAKIPGTGQSLVFTFAFIGFGTKAGIIPMHIWLPSAYNAAPSNISALMSGVMVKTAVYGIIRIAVDVLKGQNMAWGTALLVAGGISAVFGIAFALTEINIKRLVSYSSVENIGIVFVGIGLSIIALSRNDNLIAPLCLTAALLHVFNHSIFKGLLFLGTGAIHFSTKTRNMETLGGLIKKMPYTAFFFLVGVLTASSIPPFNGFVSEWLTYQSLFINIHPSASWLKIVMILLAAALAMAGVLAATSFIKAFGITFLAMPRSNSAKDAKEVPKPMLVAMGILSALCAVVGLFPILVIKLINNIDVELTGRGVLDSISGFSSFQLYPVKFIGSVVPPLTMVLLLLLLVPFLFYFVSIMKKGTKARYYGTWDCGYVALNPKMQYTATGFSKPLRIVLRGIFRPNRELEIQEGDSPYYFKSAKYTVSTMSIIEKYIYEPIIKGVYNFARRARLVIQTGSVHTYLIYMFIVIIAMFVYFARA